MRVKCDYCGSKHRSEFVLRLERTRRDVCPECVAEYQKIFSTEKQDQNTLFEAFKRGWIRAEIEQGLTPLKIPKAIERYYSSIPMDSFEDEYIYYVREFEWAKELRTTKENIHKTEN